MPFKLVFTHPDFSNRIVSKYIEKLNRYEIDTEHSSVIEFNTGGFYANNDSVLHRARFYCVTNFYARRGELVTKDEKFKKWVAGIYRSFKKSILVKHSDESSITFSKNTLKWMADNDAKIDGGYISISIKNKT